MTSSVNLAKFISCCFDSLGSPWVKWGVIRGGLSGSKIDFWNFPKLGVIFD
jgi:hypothetical protein